MRRELGMMLAGLVVAGAVAVGAAGTAQAACEPDKVATKYPGLAGKTIKVGLDPTLPPIMYRDPNNPSKIIGQDPDMVDAAMKCLGLKYELVGLDFGTRKVSREYRSHPLRGDLIPTLRNRPFCGGHRVPGYFRQLPASIGSVTPVR